MPTYDVTFLAIVRDSTGYVECYSRQLRNALTYFRGIRLRTDHANWSNLPDWKENYKLK